MSKDQKGVETALPPAGDAPSQPEAPVSRAEFDALRSEIRERMEDLEFLAGATVRSKEDIIKIPLPPGTPVLLRAGDVDFPATIISHRVVREGFAPRYRLFVIYANFTGFLSDKIEGDGDEQFRIR